MKASPVADRHRVLTSRPGSQSSGVALSRRSAGLLDRAQALVNNQFAAQLAIVFVAYLVAGKLGQATTNIRSGNIGPVWPAYGVALAGLLAYGPRVWPAVTASAFVVAFQSPVYALTALGQALGATLATAGGTMLLLRLPGFQPTLPRLRDAIAFIVVGAFGSATISASIGMASLYASGLAGYAGLAEGWLIYWLGDATGALLITPLIFQFLVLIRTHARQRQVEFAVLITTLTATCFLIFGDGAFSPTGMRMLAFAVLPFVMWAAINFPSGGAAVTSFIIAAFATLLTALGAGPFADATPFVNAVRLDVLFGVLSISGLTLAAVISEREAAHAEQERLIRAQAAMEARLHLAAIVESSNDAVLSMTPHGVILTWNAAATRIFGYSPAEMIGQAVSTLVPSWRATDEVRVLRQLAEGARIDPYEAMGVAKHGKALHLSVTVTSLRDGDGVVFGAAAILRDITASKRADEALSNLSRRLMEAQEQERRRIARELHDDIGQRLATLAINLNGSGHLQQQVAEIARDVQALSHELHSSRIDLLGITAAMRHFCSEFAEQQRSTVGFDSRDLPTHLPPEISLCLFRIMQESLHNAAKHSGSQAYDVRLWSTAGAVHLAVRDQGRGFDVTSARTGRGIGLLSMEERLKLVDGELAIESVVDRGTTVHARVPFSV